MPDASHAPPDAPTRDDASPSTALAWTAPVARAWMRLMAVPMSPPLGTSRESYRYLLTVVLRVEDADGGYGVSLLWCLRPDHARLLSESVRLLTPLALGRSPADLPRIHADARGHLSFLGYKGVAVYGLSAYDMALHDLGCRRLGLSLSALKGRRQASVPAYWSGFFPGRTLAELAEEAELAAQRGFRAVKIRVGHGSAAEDAERVRVVLEHLPDGSTVMLDANQRWSSAHEALRSAETLARFSPLWLEDPVAHNDYAGLAFVVDRSPIPIATGENEYLREGFAQLLDTGARYLLADLQRVGGIREWDAVAGAASVRGVVLTPHSYPHVAVHLCAGLDQMESWVEYVSRWEPLSRIPLEVREGRMLVPDEPGIGLEPDQEALERFALGPWEQLG